MATLLPPPSKKQKRAAQLPVEVDIIPKDLPNVLIKFQASDTGDSIGGSIRVPGNISERQLEELLNNLHKTSDDPVPYSFSLLGDKDDLVDIRDNLYTSVLKPGIKSTEDFLTLVYTPRAVFKVRPITRSSATISGHGSTILCSQFAPHTSSKMVTGAGDSTARIWDCNTQTIQHTLKGHTNWVLCVAWSPLGDVIATGSMDNTVRLWDPISGKPIGDALKGHGKWVSSLSWEPIHLVKVGSRPRLCSGSKDGTVKVWDTVARNAMYTMSGHSSSVACVKWSGSGVIYSGSHDKTIKGWREGRCVATFRAHAHWINHLALSTDFTMRVGEFQPGPSMTVNGNPSGAVTESSKAKVQEAFDKVSKIGGRYSERMVTASDDFTMYLWEPEVSDKPICRMTGHQKLVNHVSFSPDGRYIVSASFDNSVKLWDGRDGKFIATLRGHVSPVYQTAWSSDCRLLVSCSKDTTLKVWDIRTKKLMVDLPGHADEVYTVDWSVDGKKVISGGKDKKITRHFLSENQTVMSRPFKVNIIVAALIPGHGIGLKGKLPWSLKNEMKYFRLLTTNTISPTSKNVVIMGRNTWESIPSRFRPLQNRLNIVLTRNANISVENGAAVDDSVLVADSLKNGLDIIEKTGNIEEVFLIGGADLYNQCLASGLVDRIFLTEVKSLNGQIETDVSIKIDPSQWIKQESQVLEKYLQDHGVNGFQLDGNKEGELVYDFTLLERR